MYLADHRSPAFLRQFRGPTLRNNLKRTVKAFLDYLGYRLQPTDRVRPIDVRGEGDDPRLFVYHGETRPVLMDLPVNRGLSFDVFPLGDPSKNPLVRTVRRAAAAFDSEAELRSGLANYYHTVRPDSAADWLGIAPGEIPELDAQPPWGRVWPWCDHSLETRRRRVHQISLVESNDAGIPLTIDHGWKTFGPISEQMLEVEVRRFHSLLDSIREQGYRRNDSDTGDITARILWQSSTRWKWYTTGGAHRSVVLSALDYEQIPVRITNFVRADDSRVWPNVISGLYDERQARQLFARCVDGVLPAVAREAVEGASPQEKPPTPLL